MDRWDVAVSGRPPHSLPFLGPNTHGTAQARRSAAPPFTLRLPPSFLLPRQSAGVVRLSTVAQPVLSMDQRGQVGLNHIK